MQEIIPLQTLTPAFLGGADSRESAELRAPSFRGALRYWLRALLGGALGDSPPALQQIREIESRAFGVAGKEASTASALTVRLKQFEVLEPPSYKKGGVVYEEGRKYPHGRDYLYWSMGSLPSKGKTLPAKKFIQPGTAFDLVLAARPGVPDAEAGRAMAHGMAALWLLVNLGGVGARSRRTGGSLAVQDFIEEGKQVPFLWQEIPFRLGRIDIDANGRASNLAALSGEMAEQFARIKAAAGLGGQAGAFTRPPAFDCLGADASATWLLGAWETWEAAVEAIGDAFAHERLYADPDFTSVISWLNGKAIGPISKVAYGLPLRFAHRDPNNPDRKMEAALGARKPKRDGRWDPIDRRSSPLWLKLSRSADGRYVGVATLMKSLFLPDNAEVRIKSRGIRPDREDSLPVPGDYDVIADWLNDRSVFPDAVEVRLG